MNIALTFEKQFHQKAKSQERLNSSLLLLKQLTLKDISAYLGVTFKKRKFTNFYVINMVTLVL